MTEQKLTGLQKAHLVNQAKRDAGIVVHTVVLDPIAKHFANPKSKTMAIRAKCFDCVGGDADLNPRGRIGNCPVVKCPLHTVRPYQHKAQGADGDDE